MSYIRWRQLLCIKWVVHFERPPFQIVGPLGWEISREKLLWTMNVMYPIIISASISHHICKYNGT